VPFVVAAIIAAVLEPCGAIVTAQGALRTPDGHPDFQGMWVNDTATPLERTKEFADKAFFTEAEARDYEKHYQLDRTAALSHGDPAFELQAAGDLDTYEPGHVLPSLRTSLITEPADGRVPALTPAAQQRLNERNARAREHFAENPENFTNAERCLVTGNAAVPPLLPVFYNNGLRIVQTPDAIVIESEMNHDARVISLVRRAHLPPAIRRWLGDSLGHWEGATLVVDTTNFSDGTTLRGSGPDLRVVERFTLSGSDAIRYQFTIEDPSFVRPWSGESLIQRTSAPMFEYACHEANYSIVNVLRGARLAERESARPR
jgi:hypothetical protein